MRSICNKKLTMKNRRFFEWTIRNKLKSNEVRFTAFSIKREKHQKSFHSGGMPMNRENSTYVGG